MKWITPLSQPQRAERGESGTFLLLYPPFTNWPINKRKKISFYSFAFFIDSLVDMARKKKNLICEVNNSLLPFPILPIGIQCRGVNKFCWTQSRKKLTHVRSVAQLPSQFGVFLDLLTAINSKLSVPFVFEQLWCGARHLGVIGTNAQVRIVLLKGQQNGVRCRGLYTHVSVMYISVQNQ